MKIGCIFTAYQCADLLPESLAPWIAARAANLGGHTWVVAAVSVPFKGFDHGSEPKDATEEMLRGHRERGEIDRAIFSDTPMKETEARGGALKWLMTQGVDVVWQADGDEFPTEQDLARIAAFVEANQFVHAFRLSLRNAVFSRDQWLAEPFTPMRIHRAKVGTLVATGFWDDNNVVYDAPGPWSSIKGPVKDIQFAAMTVPQAVAWIEHISWLSNERSRRKIRYQLDARSWPECSFRWDDATNSLAFNEAYYQRRGLPLPEVLHA